ncbi:hypothetical protein D3C74_479880 [compost metagenome]
MYVGLNSPRSSRRVLVSGVCPRTVPPATTSTPMKRANTCARGMNSSVRPFASAKTSGSAFTALTVSE